MTIPLWCLLAVLLLPYVLAGVGGYLRTRQFGTLDNRHPRQQVANLEGVGARAYAAQANAWEAATFFAAAVLTAHVAGVPESVAAPWAVAFVVLRVLHAFFYIRDLDKARSGVFVLAFVCAIALFVQAA